MQQIKDAVEAGLFHTCAAMLRLEPDVSARASNLIQMVLSSSEQQAAPFGTHHCTTWHCTNHQPHGTALGSRQVTCTRVRQAKWLCRAALEASTVQKALQAIEATLEAVEAQCALWGVLQCMLCHAGAVDELQ